MFDKEKLYSAAKTFQSLQVSIKIQLVLYGAVILGIAAFIFGIFSASSQRVWQIFLVNFLYFTCIAQGMVVLAVTLQMTNAKWGRSIKRLAELGAYFLPFSLLFLIILYFGKNHIFPWINEPIPEKAGWLNAPFLFSRDFFAFLLMAVLSIAFLKTSVKPDRTVLKRMGEVDNEAEYNKVSNRLHTLAPIIGLLFAIIYSLIAFDLVMSLSPHWYSTLFGAYFFITTFFAGLAGLVVIMSLSRKNTEMESFINSKQFHDIGNLLFGFSIVSADFFWSQYFVIWYGNLPEETRYVIDRLQHLPWSILSKVVLFGAFVIPFVLMLSRPLKKNPKTMLGIAIFILVGMWFERFLLIVPSIWHENSFPIGILEILITLGFLAFFILTYLFALKRYPSMPVSDPLLHESLQTMHK